MHETLSASKTVPAGVSKCPHDATAVTQNAQCITRIHDAWTSQFLYNGQELESSQYVKHEGSALEGEGYLHS